MDIYKVERTDEIGYDEEKAKNTHPDRESLDDWIHPRDTAFLKLTKVFVSLFQIKNLE
jgi:hypothetical protein